MANARRTPPLSALRWLAYLILLIVVVLLLVHAGNRGEVTEGTASFLGTAAAIGVGLLLFVELAPSIRSFSAGGFSIEFGEEMSSKFLALEKRLAALEGRARSPKIAEGSEIPTSLPSAPALARPIRHRDDLHKGRFGGESKRDGFTLSATFDPSGSGQWVNVRLLVQSSKNVEEGIVEFHLHDTLLPNTIPVRFKDNSAELSVLVFGGFTVGAWIPHANVELELDLATVPRAPRVIRER